MNKLFNEEFDSTSDFGDIQEADIFLIVTLVPKLLDAYADLWELSMAMTHAWESLEESKNSLYVPDANDMVQLKRDGEL